MAEFHFGMPVDIGFDRVPAAVVAADSLAMRANRDQSVQGFHFGEGLPEPHHPMGLLDFHLLDSLSPVGYCVYSDQSVCFFELV
jgi:hypothetical protein